MKNMTAIVNPKKMMAGPAMEENGPLMLPENINIVLVAEKAINSMVNIVAVIMAGLGANDSPDGIAV